MNVSSVIKCFNYFIMCLFLVCELEFVLQTLGRSRFQVLKDGVIYDANFSVPRKT